MRVKIGNYYQVKCGWDKPGFPTLAKLIDITTYKGRRQYVWQSTITFVSYDLKGTRLVRKEDLEDES